MSKTTLNQEHLNSLKIKNEQQYREFTISVNKMRKSNGLKELNFTPFNIVSPEVEDYLKSKYGKEPNCTEQKQGKELDIKLTDYDIENYLKSKNY
jgi:phosphopantetheine adenylyltransferase